MKWAARKGEVDWTLLGAISAVVLIVLFAGIGDVISRSKASAETVQTDRINIKPDKTKPSYDERLCNDAVFVRHPSGIVVMMIYGGSNCCLMSIVPTDQVHLIEDRIINK